MVKVGSTPTVREVAMPRGWKLVIQQNPRGSAYRDANRHIARSWRLEMTKTPAAKIKYWLGCVAASVIGLVSLVGAAGPMEFVVAGTIALCILCWGVAGLVNRTTISLSRGEVIIRGYPLPTFDNISISSDELNYVFTKKSVHGDLFTKQNIYGDSERGVATYAVRGFLHDGRVVSLVAELSNQEDADYVVGLIRESLESNSTL